MTTIKASCTCIQNIRGGNGSLFSSKNSSDCQDSVGQVAEEKFVKKYVFVIFSLHGTNANLQRKGCGGGGAIKRFCQSQGAGK